MQSEYGKTSLNKLMKINMFYASGPIALLDSNNLGF